MLLGTIETHTSIPSTNVFDHEVASGSRNPVCECVCMPVSICVFLCVCLFLFVFDREVAFRALSKPLRAQRDQKAEDGQS